MTFTAFPAKPRILSLCSGIGGIDLAATWAGFEIAGQVEIDEYCQQVLAKHWPDVPKMRDIHDVQGHEFGHIDLIAGGIPCQPFSTAGKMRGKEDDRYLWPAMLRIIKTTRPSWVLIENVANFVNMALEAVLADLEDQEYQCQTFVLPACATGAPHQRMRCFVVAYTAGQGRGAPAQQDQSPTQWSSNTPCAFSVRSESPGWLSQSSLDRAIHGISRRLDTPRFPAYPGEAAKPWEEASIIPEKAPYLKDRIHALGNAVVPQQVYPILAAIYEISQS